MLLWRRGWNGGLLLLVEQRLARLVPRWVTQGSRGGAVVGWVQVYYSFIPPEIRKFVFFLIYDLNITIFLLDIIYAKHHIYIYTPKKSRIKLLYITFWPPRKNACSGF